jgi:hypothetical protein
MFLLGSEKSLELNIPHCIYSDMSTLVDSVDLEWLVITEFGVFWFFFSF